MEPEDFLSIIVITTLIFLIGVLASSSLERNLKKHFRMGLAFKVFGGLSFALVYTYYYDYGGDTRVYFSSAQNLLNLAFRKPLIFFELFFNDSLGTLTEFDFKSLFRFELSSREFFVVKITSVLALFGLNSYFGTTLMFALLSFCGTWIFYLSFTRLYPNLVNELSFAFFYFPSIFFWSSGISKDSLVLGLMGVSFYFFLLLSKKFNFFNLLISIICVYIIYRIKPYVIFSILPILIFYFFLNQGKKIQNPLIRKALVPFIFISGITTGIIGLNLLGELNPNYSIENVIKSSQQMQDWHYVEGANTADNHGRGSSYTLGKYSPSIIGILGIAPKAINVSLFRPYFWEVKNVGMLAAAIESFFTLIFTVFVILKVGLFRAIKTLIKEETAFICFAFAMIFLFFVGFSSYNFGALMRYKTPAIPFFFTSLIILMNYASNGTKNTKVIR